MSREKLGISDDLKNLPFRMREIGRRLDKVLEDVFLLYADLPESDEVCKCKHTLVFYPFETRGFDFCPKCGFTILAYSDAAGVDDKRRYKV